jgi:hypothetical protein
MQRDWRVFGEFLYWNQKVPDTLGLWRQGLPAETAFIRSSSQTSSSDGDGSDNSVSGQEKTLLRSMCPGLKSLGKPSSASPFRFLEYQKIYNKIK